MSSPHAFSGYKPPSPPPHSPPLPLATASSHSSQPLSATVLPSVVSLEQSDTGSRFAASSVAAPIIHFDPNATMSDDEDEEDDGRPKKKQRKGAAAGLASSVGAGALSDSQNGGAGTGGEDDKDKGRRKIEIEYIHKKEKRHITFSKRKAGIMKKAYELATLTGTQVLLLVVSETGIVYTFTTAKFQPLVGAGPGGNPSEGQRLIQACLAVDPSEGSDYISPPPDGPLLPLPPSAINRPFETNSAIHGGQIALRTRAHRPGASHRATKPRPAVIRTQSQGSIANALPTPVDHQGMLMSPSSRHLQPDYSQGPSVLQGSPRSETMQSAQEYTEMMHRSNGPPMQGVYANGPHPLSAGGRMEGGYGQQGMDYGHGTPPPHSAHHPHPNDSPLQQQQQHHFQQQQQQQQQGDPHHFRDDRGEYYQSGGPPPPGYHSQQTAAQEEYLAHHHNQQRR